MILNQKFMTRLFDKKLMKKCPYEWINYKNTKN